MSDYIDFHKRSIFIQKLIRFTIFISIKFPKTFFCYFWNTAFKLIGNSVRISSTNENTFLVSDKNHSIEIIYKERFEYYMQNISTRLSHLSFEYMLSSIQFTDRDVVIDCGANIGELFLAIDQQLEEQININYYGFEPVEKDFQVLSRNSKNLIDIPLALSSDEQAREFYLRPKAADSSFEPARSSKSILVDCVTIDRFFKNFENIKLLKLEAEGFELDVLVGAKKSLSKIKFITADLGFELENNTVNSFDEVDKLLRGNNFELIASTKRETYLYKNKNF